MKLSVVVCAAVMQGERSHQISEMLVPTLRCLVGLFYLNAANCSAAGSTGTILVDCDFVISI